MLGEAAEVEASRNSKRWPHWTRGLGSGRWYSPLPRGRLALWAAAPRLTPDEAETLPLLDRGQLYHFLP